MATNLDLQEQEQLDALKAFWKSYGNLITWTVILALLAFAGWRFWQQRQAQQGLEASAMYEELDRAATAADLAKVTRVLSDLQQRYPATVYAAQGSLLAAKVQADKGQLDAAKASLAWVAGSGHDADLKAMARLRLAGVHIEAGQHDEALKVLAEAMPAPFAALQADRRGDALALQGKKAEAVAAYQQARSGLSDKVDYRRFVEAKLAALGVSAAASAAVAAPAASAPAAAPAASASSGASK